MADPSGIIERPHDLARRVDPVGLGERSAGDSDGSEGGTACQKAIAMRAINKAPP
jgi:hypothetical protein